jgi:hypothetical protein
MSKFDQAMNWLSDYRKEVRKSLNITAQTLILQNHLNNLFDPLSRRILIKHSSEQSLNVGLVADGQENYFLIRLSTENPVEYSEICVALAGESQQDLDVDYLILVPVGVEINGLLAELNKYRLAGKSFTIQNS